MCSLAKRSISTSDLCSSPNSRHVPPCTNPRKELRSLLDDLSSGTLRKCLNAFLKDAESLRPPSAFKLDAGSIVRRPTDQQELTGLQRVSDMSRSAVMGQQNHLHGCGGSQSHLRAALPLAWVHCMQNLSNLPSCLESCQGTYLRGPQERLLSDPVDNEEFANRAFF